MDPLAFSQSTNTRIPSYRGNNYQNRGRYERNEKDTYSPNLQHEQNTDLSYDYQPAYYQPAYYKPSFDNKYDKHQFNNQLSYQYPHKKIHNQYYNLENKRYKNKKIARENNILKAERSGNPTQPLFCGHFPYDPDKSIDINNLFDQEFDIIPPCMSVLQYYKSIREYVALAIVNYEEKYQNKGNRNYRDYRDYREDLSAETINNKRMVIGFVIKKCNPIKEVMKILPNITDKGVICFSWKKDGTLSFNIYFSNQEDIYKLDDIEFNKEYKRTFCWPEDDDVITVADSIAPHFSEKEVYTFVGFFNRRGVGHQVVGIWHVEELWSKYFKYNYNRNFLYDKKTYTEPLQLTPIIQQMQVNETGNLRFSLTKDGNLYVVFGNITGKEYEPLAELRNLFPDNNHKFKCWLDHDKDNGNLFAIVKFTHDEDKKKIRRKIKTTPIYINKKILYPDNNSEITDAKILGGSGISTYYLTQGHKNLGMWHVKH